MFSGLPRISIVLVYYVSVILYNYMYRFNAMSSPVIKSMNLNETAIRSGYEYSCTLHNSHYYYIKNPD